MAAISFAEKERRCDRSRASVRFIIHLSILIPARREYRAFIRSLTGLLARKFGKGLWQVLPFTRVLHWGKDFRQANAYIRQNREEVEGQRPYTPRKNWYARYTRSG